VADDLANGVQVVDGWLRLGRWRFRFLATRSLANGQQHVANRITFAESRDNRVAENRAQECLVALHRGFGQMRKVPRDSVQQVLNVSRPILPQRQPRFLATFNVVIESPLVILGGTLPQPSVGDRKEPVLCEPLQSGPRSGPSDAQAQPYIVRSRLALLLAGKLVDGANRELFLFLSNMNAEVERLPTPVNVATVRHRQRS